MTRSKHIKALAVLSAAIVLIGAFAGCTTASPAASQAPSQAPQAAATPAATPKEPLSLTYWVTLDSNVAQTFKNLGDTPLYQELEKRTGVKVTFQHPATGSEQDQFNLMIASRELPDVIETNWVAYPGGPEKAFTDNIIVKANSLIDKDAPNLKAILASDKDLDKMVKTDAGNYAGFPFIKSSDHDYFSAVWHGPQLRKDLMDKFGLSVPQTVDDWTNVLKAFQSNGIEIPLSVIWSVFDNQTITNVFVGAYGAGMDFMQVDGKVLYGPIQPGYKDFLTLFSSWYSQKLLDPDFATQDRNAFDAKVTSGKIGSFMGNAGGNMGKYLDAVRPSNPTFDLVGAPYPGLKAGEVPLSGQRDFRYDFNSCTAITTSNKHPDETAAWLDYGYSSAGSLLFNFGVENVSYTMVDEAPKLTELITKNPNGLTLSQAWAQYSRYPYNGPFLESYYAALAYFPYPQQLDAVAKWAKADVTWKMPPITTTADEANQIATSMNDIKTYVNEMTLKFIMGQEPLSNFDAYAEQVKKMGIDQAIQIEQAALDRYSSR